MIGVPGIQDVPSKVTPPKDVKTNADVIRLVFENRSAIGFIDSVAVIDKVKTVSAMK